MCSKYPEKGSLGIFSDELTLTCQLIAVSSPKDSYIGKKLKDPFPIPSLFSSGTNIITIIFPHSILITAAPSKYVQRNTTFEHMLMLT